MIHLTLEPLWSTCRVTVYGIALMLSAACGTDEPDDAEPHGQAILKVRVTADDSGDPVPAATIRIYADYEQDCAQQGPLTAEVVTDEVGTFRVQSEGIIMSGGTCFSLGVEPPLGTPLQAVQHVPFVVEFRTSAPLDSVQVDVALDAAP